jgi:hypothetical protein
MDVKPDAGAGVGKAGVTTPWETGNLGKTDDWAMHSRGSSSPNDMNENKKNSAGTGEEWAHPWEGPSLELGKLGSPEQNSSGKQ